MTADYSLRAQSARELPRTVKFGMSSLSEPGSDALFSALRLRGPQSQLRCLVVLWAISALSFPSPSAAAPPENGSDHPPVILISVDTLRADVLGCYGSRKPSTPHIDAIARGGTLFVQASSQVPLTLPSHTSMLASTYPFFNGIEENGEVVPPGTLTLTTVLQSRGYHAGAFIGGFALDRRFGLDQGFETYDSPFGVHAKQGARQYTITRPGKEVADAATHWVDENSSHPFFLFLHLYDLHRPYLQPSARNHSDRTGYELELSYVDEVLGQFWEYLARTGLLDKALIVFTSDHGEGLGEHGEETHEYFIYQSTLRVPLIIHWPRGGPARPARVDQPVGLIDLAPTILQFLGIPQPRQFQGQSLFGLLTSHNGAASREVYGETVYARDHLGCSVLRSLRRERYKYIDAPKAELYDLQSDPGELRNLCQREASLAQALRQQLLRLQGRFAATKPVPTGAQSVETKSMLNSLGYTELAYPHGAPDASGCDPKDRLAEYHLYGRAVGEAQTGNYKGAIDRFRQVLARDPQHFLSHYYLAVSCFHVDELDEALKELQRTLELSPSYAPAGELLGTIWLKKGDYARAQEQFQQLLKVSPHDYGANFNLGVLATRKGQFQEAIRYLRAAVDANPQSPAAHRALGTAYQKAGDPRQAEAEFKQAITLQPQNAATHHNLDGPLTPR